MIGVQKDRGKRRKGHFFLANDGQDGCEGIVRDWSPQWKGWKAVGQAIALIKSQSNTKDKGGLQITKHQSITLKNTDFFDIGNGSLFQNDVEIENS